jgi:hypothetical protein
MSKIDEFLQMYEGKGTFGVYRWAIGEFFKTVDVDSDHYFTDQRNYEDDIKNFLQQINSKPPKTVRLQHTLTSVFYGVKYGVLTLSENLGMGAL